MIEKSELNAIGVNHKKSSECQKIAATLSFFAAGKHASNTNLNASRVMSYGLNVKSLLERNNSQKIK
ncbi:MAG TPA: hypothetical protein VIP53_03245 [Nitrososphaera sp.]